MSEETPKAMPTIQRPYGERMSPGIDTGNETKVWQASKDETDVNIIMANYAKTGVVTHQNTKQPMYGDFSNSITLQEALKVAEAAKAGFQNLPPEVRFLAGNDPVKFLQMVESGEHTEAFQKAGLTKPIDVTKAGPKPDAKREDPPKDGGSN